MMNVQRLHAIVHGRVQGVGFRYFVHHTAQRLTGIVGYVKNRPDGTVEVEAESEDRALLETLFHELHVGPEMAQVTSVDVVWEADVEPRFIGFRVS